MNAFKCQGEIASALGLWIFFMTTTVFFLDQNQSTIFFHFGPSKNVKFVGIYIDNWNIWIFLMIFRAI